MGKRGALHNTDLHRLVHPPRPAYIVADNGCWIWNGHRPPDHYPKRYWRGKSHLAHRLFYQELVGPIPEGLTIDHKCRNKHCVNPAHLEPVTMRENILRAVPENCKRGHNDWKLVNERDRLRVCRECKRLCDRRLRATGRKK